jgi:hypothetical protein
VADYFAGAGGHCVICTGIPPYPKARAPWIVATICWMGRNRRPYATDMSWRVRREAADRLNLRPLLSANDQSPLLSRHIPCRWDTPKATPLGSEEEEEAEAFIEQAAPERNER